MKHCICKIKNDDKAGVGFFCNINLDENFKCHTLVTSYNMFNEDDIKKNQSLNIYFNDDKENKSIILDNNRRIYFNENFGIRILIIENNDNINNEKNYLDLDDNLLDNDFSYENKSLYILQYQNNNKASVSFGKLKDIKESEIFHLCKVENCSDGSPILNLSNNKVIGIQNKPQNSGFNCGTFLKIPIKEMIDMKEKLKSNKIIKKKKILKIENVFQISLNINLMNNHMQNQINDNVYQMNNINNMNNNNNQIINQIPFNVNNMNMNMDLFCQNNLDFGMVMNNNMNIGNPIHNNMGFNMNNNNLINNMHMFNNIGLNQMNMNNNNININQQKININDIYIDKLRKNSPKKINVTFNYQKRNVFIVDYGTTIREILINYLKFSGMFYISECITFLYNATKLNIDDQRPVEVACSYNYDIIISVSVSDVVVIKKFFFETTSHITLNLLFDGYSTIEELFQAFFNELGSPQLFGKNNNIFFIFNGAKVKYNEKEIIESLFTNNNNNVLVSDPNDLIRGNLHL